MVVEQRIGRIDRLGQKSERIHIINLVCEDSVEERILLRLYDRINIFEESIGEIEPILGPIIKSITQDLMNPELTEQEKEMKAERSEQALIREKKYMRELENESDKLFGLGDLIKEKVDEVKELGRFVTGKQLELYVNHFLEEYCPGITLMDKEGRKANLDHKMVRYLKVGSQLRSYFNTVLSRVDEDDIYFRHLINKNDLCLVFYSEIANETPNAEFIHSRHPLIKCVTEYYKNNAVKAIGTFRLQLSCDFVNSGPYFFAWTSIDEKGVWDSRFIKSLFINLETKTTIENNLAEKLMHDIVIHGRDLLNMELSESDSEFLFKCAEEYFSEYVDSYKKTRQREADAVVLRRKQALEASNKVLIDRRLRSIETARSKNRKESVINMHEGKISKLNLELTAKLHENDSEKNISVSFNTIQGAGLLLIK